MLPTQDVRRINIKKGKIRDDKSSWEYALAPEMFYSDSIYDICGASSSCSSSRNLWEAAAALASHQREPQGAHPGRRKTIKVKLLLKTIFCNL